MKPLDDDRRFAAALEECSQRLVRGETVDDCLNDYPPEYRLELAGLLSSVPRLRQAGHDPSSDFRNRLEGRFLTAVDEERQRRRSGLFAGFRRRFTSLPSVRTAMIAVTVLLFFAIGGAGIVQASQSSLPDSPLYQVKTAREWVQLFLARDAESKVGVQGSQVEQRGRELQLAVRAGKAPRVIEALTNRLSAITDRIVTQALDLQAHGNNQPAIRTSLLLRAAQQQLDTLEAQAAPAARPALDRLRIALAEQELRLLRGSFPNRPRPGTGGPAAKAAFLELLPPGQAVGRRSGVGR